MRWMCCLWLLVLAVPAVADDGWQFDESGAVLQWGEGVELRPGSEGRTGGGERIGDVPWLEVESLAPNAWRVTRRDAPGEAPVWERRLAVDAVRAHSRASDHVSMAPWLGSKGGRVETPVALAGRDVVIGLGGGSLIVAIDAPTGLVRWQVAHIAEYVRSREDPPNYMTSMVRVRARGERTRLLHDAFVSAGPIAVAHEGSYRIFVGVTENRFHETATSIPESRVYEIDATGSVHAVVELPQEITFQGARPMSGGVVLRMVAGALARVEPSFQISGGWRGAGDTDRIARLVWYVGSPTGWDPFPAEAQASRPWLVTPDRSGAFAVVGPHAVVARGGAEADAPEDGTWTFPLRRFDGDGRFVDMELRIPFRGHIPTPQVNTHSWHLPDGTRRFEPFGPYGAWLEGFEVRGDRLIVRIRRSGGGRHRFAFAIPGAESDPPKGLRPPPPAPIETVDPPWEPVPPPLADLTRPGWPEARVDAADYVEPLVTAEGVPVLVDLATAGPSPLQRAAVAALATLPSELEPLVPTEAIPGLLEQIAASGVGVHGTLLFRAVEEAPPGTVASLARIRLSTHSVNDQMDATHPLMLGGVLGEDGREYLRADWLDRARNSPPSPGGGWGIGSSREDDVEEPSDVREERWAWLRGLLDDGDPSVRSGAAIELYLSSDPAARNETMESALAMARSAFMGVRYAGVLLLHGLAEDLPEHRADVAADLVEVLDTPDPKVVRACIEALGDLGAAATTVTAAVREAARDGDEDIRLEAISTLGAITSPDDLETIDYLESLAAGTDPTSATYATSALKRIRSR